MASHELFTLQDAMEHLRDVSSGALRSPEENRVARRAVLMSLEHIASVSDWNYTERVYRLNFNAGYSTGTIAFDLTGGTYERQLTLSSGTWPSWAGSGTVRIADVDYMVAKRISDTVLTIDSIQCPTADIDSGTTYELTQDTYTLPADFVAMTRPQPETEFYAKFVSHADWLALRRYDSGSGDLIAWTVAQDPRNKGRQAVFVWPPPDEAESHDFWYRRLSRPLVHSGFESATRDGTVSISGTTATFSASTKTSNMAGSLLRVRDSTNNPDGRAGIYPYVEQMEIDTYTSSTVLKLVSSASTTYSGVKYTISDPVDIAMPMRNAYLACCEWMYSRLRGATDVKSKFDQFQYELRIARAADQPDMTGRSAWGSRFGGRRLADMPLGDDE